MTSVQTQRSVSMQAFDSLATLPSLMLEAGLSQDVRQLTFRILNRTTAFCRYDRAVLWGLPGGSPRLLGVSGDVEVNRQSPLAGEWRTIVSSIRRPDTAAIIGPNTLSGANQTWARLIRRTGGLSVIWLPIRANGRPVAGLWLERWGQATFADRDVSRLAALAVAYGVAWRSVARPPSRSLMALKSRKGWTIGAVATALLVALCLVRIPLRIVVQCEVVPDEPLLITAPLAGVIDEVTVLPGRSASAGELLAVYDRRVADEEFEVARRQVQIVEADLQRARVESFDAPATKAEVALLGIRLAQEKTRLRLAQYRVGKLEVRAPASGTLMFDDPNQWRGRPVQVGERIMMIVDAQRTKVRIWLPERDNIPLDWDRPVNVVLDSDPGASRRAQLRFLANHSEVTKDGVSRFRAEADWVGPRANVTMGLQGTAVLYGQRVPLGYWLLRRPMAAFRRFFGV